MAKPFTPIEKALIQILSTLKQFSNEERMALLVMLCKAWIETNGTLEAESL